MAKLKKTDFVTTRFVREYPGDLPGHKPGDQYVVVKSHDVGRTKYLDCEEVCLSKADGEDSMTYVVLRKPQ